MPEGVVERPDPSTGAIEARSQANGDRDIELVVRGDVDSVGPGYARSQLAPLLEQVGEPVLFARVKLTEAADPARERPALAEVAVDVNGDLVRAHVAARTIREAVDLLVERLRDKFEHRATHRRALRRDDGLPEPGTWRHGDLPTARPTYFDRPTEERELVRHKSFTLDEITPDEAAFDMDQLDYEFHLFRDLTSGDDAVLARTSEGTYRLARLQPRQPSSPPTAIALEADTSVPFDATVEEALARLDDGHEPFVFFRNVGTGRGNVVYRRYDGHYGLITPA